MVYGKILGSAIAHGRVKRIDTSKAEALEGVLAVMTGKDVPDTQYGVSPARYDEYVLARDKVRHVGDEVAAVAAIDEKTAEKAIELIEVEYEELPNRYSTRSKRGGRRPADSRALQAQRQHPRRSRLRRHGQGFRGIAPRARGVVHRQPHLPVPARTARGHRHLGPDGTLVLYSSTQVPHYVQYMMAHVLHMPLGKVRVIARPSAADSAARPRPRRSTFCAALFSKKLGRPVKMVYSREDMFHHGRGRHKQHMKFKLGVDKNGKIKAFKSEIYLDGGAYSSFGVATAYYAGSVIPTLYTSPTTSTTATA